MAHTHGALVLVDNSIMSSVLSQPLELGAGMNNMLIRITVLSDGPNSFIFYGRMLLADLVMNSATKFISGHSDVMAGVLSIKGERL